MATAAVTTSAPSRQRSELVMKIFPKCVCGMPYPKHVCVETGCTQYTPIRPIEDHGLVAYAHDRMICRVLAKIEQWAHNARTYMEARSK